PLADATRKGLLEDDPMLLRPTPLGRRFLNDLQELFLGSDPMSDPGSDPAFRKMGSDSNFGKIESDPMFRGER
ncbi:MAG TPA: hypothetical protein VGL90_10190, partial [Casimicrobiaceae bacterium]